MKKLGDSKLIGNIKSYLDVGVIWRATNKLMVKKKAFSVRE